MSLNLWIKLTMHKLVVSHACLIEKQHTYYIRATTTNTSPQYLLMIRIISRYVSFSLGGDKTRKTPKIRNNLVNVFGCR